MRTPGDPDEFGKDLGKKVTPPPAATGDEWEFFRGQHGDRLERNKRTGEIRSAVPRRIKYTPTSPAVDHYAEAIKRSLEQQEEDGYPNVYWGTF